MASKDPLVNKRARDKWYQENKQHQIARQLERRKELIDEITEYKRTLACVDCGCSFKDHPEWLDFHHLDSSAKENTIGMLIKSSRAAAFREIAKCVALCSNCHRTRHLGDLYAKYN